MDSRQPLITSAATGQFLSPHSVNFIGAPDLNPYLSLARDTNAKTVKLETMATENKPPFFSNSNLEMHLLTPKLLCLHLKF